MSYFDTSSTDAMHWAEQFCEHAAVNDWKLEDIDEGLLVCWFSNYWAAVHDPLSSEIDKLKDEVDNTKLIYYIKGYMAHKRRSDNEQCR